MEGFRTVDNQGNSNIRVFKGIIIDRLQGYASKHHFKEIVENEGSKTREWEVRGQRAEKKPPGCGAKTDMCALMCKDSLHLPRKPTPPATAKKRGRDVWGQE
jgi:hypothetical protein